MTSAVQTLDKIGVASRAAAMADQARLLNRADRRATHDDAYNERLRDTLARARLGDGMAAPPPAEGDDMQISIDSPVIVNHHYPAPAVSPSADAPAAATDSPSTASTWLKKAAVAAALLGTGGGAGVGIPWAAGAFSKAPAVAPVVAPVVTPAAVSSAVPASVPQLGKDFRLELVPESPASIPNPSTP